MRDESHEAAPAAAARDVVEVNGGGVMKKVGRFVRWALVQGAFVATVWLGTVGGYEGAENVAAFWTWLVFACSLTMLSPDVARRVRRVPPVAPKWLRFALRGVVLVLMVWHGWHFTALAYILSLVLLSFGSRSADEETGGEAGAAHG